MGVGASDSNTLIVRIDGKETRVTVAGVSAGSERGTAFAQCLVAGRVLRISGPRSSAKVTLLDDSAVSGHIAEFLQSQTSADPCTLGKAAYHPRTAQAAPAAVAPLPVVTKKKPREVHVSFAGGEMSKNSVNMPASVPLGVPATPAPQYPQRPQPSNDPTYANPATVQPYVPATVSGTTMQQAGTSAGLTQAPTEAPPKQDAEQMQPQKTETIQTTTYAPRPPV